MTGGVGGVASGSEGSGAPGAPPSAPPAPRVSVVIPTRDRRAFLEVGLRALERQTLGAAAFEVVVVDDGSRDGTRDLVEAAAARGPLAIHLVRESGRGPAVARNAGARAARAHVVAFLDDDAVADPGWLEAGLGALARDSAAVAIEGRVRVDPSERIGPFSRLVENETGGRYLTCNLFVRAEAFQRAGGFDARFGPHHYFREDTDLAFALLEAGGEIPFEPAASVAHPPLDAGPWWPLRQARKYRHDRLLWLKHPALCAARLDAHVLFGARVLRPRQRAYALHVAGVLAGLLLAAAGHPREGFALALAASAPTIAVHLAPLARARRGRLAGLVAAPLVAVVGVAASWVYAVTVAREAIAPRVDSARRTHGTCASDDARGGVG